MYNHKNAIEHQEPIIVTTRGVFKQSVAQVALAHIKEKEAEAKAKAAEEARARAAIKSCPLRAARNGLSYGKCENTCGWYIDNGCSLVVMAQNGIEIKDGQDKRCPLAPIKCSDECALFDGGCAIAKIALGMKTKEEPNKT